PRIAVLRSGAQTKSARYRASASGDSLHGFEIVRRRLAGLAIHHDFERNALTFPELAQAGAFHGADMDEHVLAAALRLNESITLLRVEPLDGAVIHESLL